MSFAGSLSAIDYHSGICHRVKGWFEVFPCRVAGTTSLKNWDNRPVGMGGRERYWHCHEVRRTTSSTVGVIVPRWSQSSVDGGSS